MKHYLAGLLPCGALLLFALLGSAPVRADEIGTAGRAIAAKWQTALVTVTISAKITGSEGGMERSDDNKTVVPGVTVDPSGLIAVSLSSADPAEAMASMGAPEDMKIAETITSVMIRMNDGKEVPGDIVLRDKDRDLAFIRPKTKPDAAPPCVDLTDAGKPEMLDQVIVLSKLGAQANRAVNLTVERVSAVLEKPQLAYVLGSASYLTQTGVPVFTLDGKLAGLLLQKMSHVKGEQVDMLLIVLPASDVADAAKQAMEAH